MIEVNLYSVPTPTTVKEIIGGTLLARSRYNKDQMGIGVLEFVKGFLKNNITEFDSILKNPGINELISGDITLTRRDLSCINYCLVTAGFYVQIINVADDEENPDSIPLGVNEWNIIDNNFIQNDYPTSIKIIPAETEEHFDTIKKVVSESGLFDTNKFSGVKNPFTSLIANMDRIKKMSGITLSTGITMINNILSQLGVDVFYAQGPKL